MNITIFDYVFTLQFLLHLEFNLNSFINSINFEIFCKMVKKLEIF